MGNKQGTPSFGSLRVKRRPDTRARNWSFHVMDGRRCFSVPPGSNLRDVSPNNESKRGSCFLHESWCPKRNFTASPKYVATDTAGGRDEAVGGNRSQVGKVFGVMSTPEQGVLFDNISEESIDSKTPKRLTEYPRMRNQRSRAALLSTNRKDAFPVRTAAISEPKIECNCFRFGDPWIRLSESHESCEDITIFDIREKTMGRKQLFKKMPKDSGEECILLKSENNLFPIQVLNSSPKRRTKNANSDIYYKNRKTVIAKKDMHVYNCNEIVNVESESSHDYEVHDLNLNSEMSRIIQNDETTTSARCYHNDVITSNVLDPQNCVTIPSVLHPQTDVTTHVLHFQTDSSQKDVITSSVLSSETEFNACTSDSTACRLISSNIPQLSNPFPHEQPAVAYQNVDVSLTIKDTCQAINFVTSKADPNEQFHQTKRHPQRETDNVVLQSSNALVVDNYEEVISKDSDIFLTFVKKDLSPFPAPHLKDFSSIGTLNIRDFSSTETLDVINLSPLETQNIRDFSPIETSHMSDSSPFETSHIKNVSSLTSPYNKYLSPFLTSTSQLSSSSRLLSSFTASKVRSRPMSWPEDQHYSGKSPASIPIHPPQRVPVPAVPPRNVSSFSVSTVDSKLCSPFRATLHHEDMHLDDNTGMTNNSNTFLINNISCSLVNDFSSFSSNDISRSLNNQRCRSLVDDSRKSLNSESCRSLIDDSRKSLNSESCRSLIDDSRKSLNSESCRSLIDDSRKSLNSESCRSLIDDSRKSLNSESCRSLIDDSGRSVSNESCNKATYFTDDIITHVANDTSKSAVNRIITSGSSDISPLLSNHVNVLSPLTNHITTSWSPDVTTCVTNGVSQIETCRRKVYTNQKSRHRLSLDLDTFTGDNIGSQRSSRKTLARLQESSMSHSMDSKHVLCNNNNERQQEKFNTSPKQLLYQLDKPWVTSNRSSSNNTGFRFKNNSPHRTINRVQYFDIGSPRLDLSFENESTVNCDRNLSGVDEMFRNFDASVSMTTSNCATTPTTSDSGYSTGKSVSSSGKTSPKTSTVFHNVVSEINSWWRDNSADCDNKSSDNAEGNYSLAAGVCSDNLDNVFGKIDTSIQSVRKTDEKQLSFDEDASRIGRGLLPKQTESFTSQQASSCDMSEVCPSSPKDGLGERHIISSALKGRLDVPLRNLSCAGGDGKEVITVEDKMGKKIRRDSSNSCMQDDCRDGADVDGCSGTCATSAINGRTKIDKCTRCLQALGSSNTHIYNRNDTALYRNCEPIRDSIVSDCVSRVFVNDSSEDGHTAKGWTISNKFNNDSATKLGARCDFYIKGEAATSHQYISSEPTSRTSSQRQVNLHKLSVRRKLDYEMCYKNRLPAVLFNSNLDSKPLKVAERDVLESRRGCVPSEIDNNDESGHKWCDNYTKNYENPLLLGNRQRLCQQGKCEGSISVDELGRGVATVRPFAEDSMTSNCCNAAISSVRGVKQSGGGRDVSLAITPTEDHAASTSGNSRCIQSLNNRQSGVLYKRTSPNAHAIAPTLGAHIDDVCDICTPKSCIFGATKSVASEMTAENKRNHFKHVREALAEQEMGELFVPEICMPKYCISATTYSIEDFETPKIKPNHLASVLENLNEKSSHELSTADIYLRTSRGCVAINSTSNTTIENKHDCANYVKETFSEGNTSRMSLSGKGMSKSRLFATTIPAANDSLAKTRPNYSKSESSKFDEPSQTGNCDVADRANSAIGISLQNGCSCPDVVSDGEVRDFTKESSHDRAPTTQLCGSACLFPSGNCVLFSSQNAHNLSFKKFSMERCGKGVVSNIKANKDDATTNVHDTLLSTHRSLTNKDQTNIEQTHRDQANRDQTNRVQANRDQANRDRTNKVQANKDQTNREQTHREQANRDQANREHTNRDQTNKDQTNIEQTHRDQANRDLYCGGYLSTDAVPHDLSKCDCKNIISKTTFSRCLREGIKSAYDLGSLARNAVSLSGLREVTERLYEENFDGYFELPKRVINSHVSHVSNTPSSNDHLKYVSSNSPSNGQRYHVSHSILNQDQLLLSKSANHDQLYQLPRPPVNQDQLYPVAIPPSNHDRLYTAHSPSTNHDQLYHAPSPSTNHDQLYHAPSPSTNHDQLYHAPSPSTNHDQLYHAPSPSTNHDQLYHAPSPSTNHDQLYPVASPQFNHEKLKHHHHPHQRPSSKIPRLNKVVSNPENSMGKFSRQECTGSVYKVPSISESSLLSSVISDSPLLVRDKIMLKTSGDFVTDIVSMDSLNEETRLTASRSYPLDIAKSNPTNRFTNRGSANVNPMYSGCTKSHTDLPDTCSRIGMVRTRSGNCINGEATRSSRKEYVYMETVQKPSTVEQDAKFKGRIAMGLASAHIRRSFANLTKNTNAEQPVRNVYSARVKAQQPEASFS